MHIISSVRLNFFMTAILFTLLITKPEGNGIDRDKTPEQVNMIKLSYNGGKLIIFKKIS